MPARSLHERRLSSSGTESSSADVTRSTTSTESSPASPTREPSTSRRRLLAGLGATASICLAGCGGRVPGTAASIETAARTDGNTLIWDYPASAGQSEGIGYAAIRFRAFDAADSTPDVDPVLRFRLNSTVGNLAREDSDQGFQADWFRFRIGVPRTYENVASLRAFVEPKQWPEIRTTYGYRNGRRELLVHAPEVNEDSTIIVEGRFRSTSATLPRQVHCRFEVQASRPNPLGRTVVADGRETFDLSTLDRPESLALD